MTAWGSRKCEETWKSDEKSDPYRKRLRVRAAFYHLDTGGEGFFIQFGVQEL